MGSLDFLTNEKPSPPWHGDSLMTDYRLQTGGMYTLRENLILDPMGGLSIPMLLAIDDEYHHSKSG